MKYCGTPPEHMLFGLRCALDMILEEGLDAVIRRHELLAGTVRSAVTGWAKGGAIEFNIIEPAERANSVTTIAATGGQDCATLLAWCENQCGVKLGITIGDLYGKGFRIAHMGHVNAPMILGVLGVVEAGLNALNWPHGSGGVQAAVNYLGEQLADQAGAPV